MVLRVPVPSRSNPIVDTNHPVICSADSPALPLRAVAGGRGRKWAAPGRKPPCFGGRRSETARGLVDSKRPVRVVWYRPLEYLRIRACPGSASPEGCRDSGRRQVILAPAPDRNGISRDRRSRKHEEPAMDVLRRQPPLVVGLSCSGAASPRASQRKQKTAFKLWKTRSFSEAEGSRTLNLRIDSPML